MNPTTVIRPELLSLTDGQLQALMPYFWIFGACILGIVVAVIRSFGTKWPMLLVSLAGTAGAGYLAYWQMKAGTVPLFNGMMISDAFSGFFNLIFTASAALTLLVSLKYLDRESLQYPEYSILVLFAALGMMLMASAADLIVMFIALEIMSLSVYVLAGFRRADRRSNEAAIKYFILGSAASAVFLYGAALVYGATGTTNIQAVLQFVTTNPQGGTAVFTLGAWLVILGFLFKVASVPFHMWMPDVYEGAPAPVTGFMTTGLKAAAFAAFIRVFISMGYGKAGLAVAMQGYIHHIIWAIAVLTMLIGNIVALTQTNLKRMLAYSSISHTGYLLVGLLVGGATGNEQGYAPMALYLVAYSVMNLGAFAILSIIAAREDHGLGLHDLAGFAKRSPWLAFAMSVFLFSMAGLPPTAGFAAKYLLFYSAVQAGEIWLVVLGVLCSAISVYYYLRVLVFMYMREPVTGAQEPAASRSFWAAVVVAAMVVATLQIGILPANWMELAKRALVGF